MTADVYGHLVLVSNRQAVAVLARTVLDDADEA
jgi:hypothetical protein